MFLGAAPSVKAELEVATNQIRAQSWEQQLRRELAPTDAGVRERRERVRRQATGTDAQAGFEAMTVQIAEALVQERIDRRLQGLGSESGTRSTGAR